MRAVFVFVLLALLVCCNGIATAESAVKVSALHSDAIETPVNNAITRRRLRGADAEEEERFMGLEKLASRVKGLFSSNPGLVQKAEQLQKSPSAVKALEKATLSEKGSSKLRAYFARLSANSSKTEKFFIIATILLFIVGAGITWGKLV